MRYLLLSLLVLTVSCISNKIVSSLDYSESNFETLPKISYSNGNYYLQYKIKHQDNSTRRLITYDVINDTLVFYAAGKLSYNEYDHPVNFQLDKKLNAYCADGKAFWMNKDGSLSALSPDNAAETKEQ